MSAANPVAALFGPIFQKEVRTAGRRRSTYVLRALYCVGLLVILVAAFLIYRSAYNTKSVVLHLQSMQRLAPTLTLVVAWFQFGMLFLIAPILAAGSICDERRARSLDVLMTTPMTAAQIVLGKLSSRIVQLVILALLATPALLAVRVFGGLSAEVVLATSCISISTAVLGASLAVMYSARQKRGTIAALFGFLTLLLIQAGPSMVEGIRFHIANEWVVNSPYRGNILATSSPATLALLTNAVDSSQPLPRVVLHRDPAGPVPMAPWWDLGPMWLLNTAYNLGAAGLITLYTTLVLRRAMKRSASREGLLARSAPLDRGPADETGPNPASVDDNAQERYRSRDRLVSDNPVLWREIRQPTFGSRTLFRVVAVLTVASLVVLYFLAGMSNVGLHGAIAYIACGATVFQAVFLTSGPFAGERESRTWEVLLTTTLSPGQILRGKFLGLLRGFWFIPAVAVAHFAVASAIGYIRPIGILYLALIMAGPAILLTSTGLFLSLRFKRAVTAGALNLVIALLLYGVVWFTPLVLPLSLRIILLIPSQFGLVNPDLAVDSMLDDHFAQILDGIYAANPFALIDTAISPCLLEEGPRGIARVPFETRLILHELKMPDCTWIVLSVFAGYVLLAGAALAIARWRFKDWGGRAS